MNKPFKNILILVLILSFLLIGCNNNLIKEEDIKEYEQQKKVIVLENYISSNNLILLYENENQYVIDYCYKDGKEKSIQSISRYNFKTNKEDKIVFKCFGTENEDFVIIIFKDDRIFNNTKKYT